MKIDFGVCFLVNVHSGWVNVHSGWVNVCWGWVKQVVLDPYFDFQTEKQIGV